MALGAIALFSLLPAADPVSGPRPASERRPSILLLIADDLADWHLGAYGNREIRTPNLDRLAAEGIRMAGSFCATPICSPSRATLFTGRLPPQHGIHCFLTPRPGKDPPQGQAEVPESFRDEVMISDLLAGAGYRTGYIGKWHMGDDARPQHGFQEWCARIEGSGYRDPVLSVNGTRVEEKGYTTEVLTRRAVGYIRARAEEDGPWFLVVSYPNPHLPYEGHPQRYYDLYRDVSFGSIGIEPLAPNALRERSEMRDPVGNLRKAAASTTALDDQVPALLEALEETSQRARTLVVFTGDNGFLYGRHGAWSKGYATNPINLYEEVVRVPMIFSWPGGLPGGRVLPELVSFYDLLPTLCEAAGVEPGTLARLVKERDLPGRSYWPILTGRTPDRPWENAVFFFFRNVEGIRDQRFKLVLRNRGEGPEELFDLKEDPRERRNLSGAPELAAVEQAMRERLRGWMDRRRPAADPPAREDLFISGEDGYAAYRIPALLADGKGVLLAFCEGRKRSFADDGDIDILLRRSEDGGRSWGRRILVRDDGPDTAGNPCPVLDPSTGTVWLLYCRNNRRVFVTSSADGGTSWSPPAEITAEVSRPGWTWYATGPGHGVRLRSGRLLIPCDHKTENATRDEAHLYCSHVIWSDDGGAS